MNIARMSAEELNTFAGEIVRGEVYLRLFRDDEYQDIQDSWGLLLACLTDDQREEIAENAFGMYAYMKDALPLGINGKPMFIGARFLHREDQIPLYERVSEIEEAFKVKP